MSNEINRVIENNIGMCMVAGGVTVGFDLVLKEVRSRKAKFVVVSDDASPRTKKQITDKCSFYGIPCFMPCLTSERLSKAVGKRSACMAAAFTGKGPWQSVLDAIDK